MALMHSMHILVHILGVIPVGCKNLIQKDFEEMILVYMRPLSDKGLVEPHVGWAFSGNKEGLL